eukprot:SAG31_NODE_28991_length_402_cov_1.155116_1_plen_65_part_10
MLDLQIQSLLPATLRRRLRNARLHAVARTAHGDTFSISALHLAIKVPYFSNSGHKNEKVTPYLML